MEETLQPLPVEEEIKHDPRFSYALGIKPELINPLKDAVLDQKENPENQHSKFWLTYLELWNKMANDRRAGLIEENIDTGSNEAYDRGELRQIEQSMSESDNAYFKTRDGREHVSLITCLIIDVPPEGIVELGDFMREWPISISDKVRQKYR